jgi:sialic acid synthase SpsE
VKLSSGEVDHIPLIRHCAEHDVAVFLDLAKSNLWEVARACEEYQGHGGENICVMHNPVGYPASPELIDLRRIRVLKESLNAPVGYTCHSPGTAVIAAAIGMGAVVVEKPVCPDKTLPYIEYAFAENMQDYGAFVDQVRYLSKALGDGHRIWSADVLAQNRVNRHGLVTTRALPAGHELSSEDVAIARPGLGILPEYHELLPGRVLKRALEEGEVIRWEDV